MLALGLLVTTMLVAVTIAMFRSDAAIDRNPVSTTGTVLSVGPLRTGIEFVDDKGHAVRPSTGVLYPGLLAVGQRFVVEYAADDPTLVRVAGRSAPMMLPAVGIWLAGTWALVAALLFAVHDRAARLGRARRTVG